MSLFRRECRILNVLRFLHAEGIVVSGAGICSLLCGFYEIFKTLYFRVKIGIFIREYIIYYYTPETNYAKKRAMKKITL